MTFPKFFRSLSLRAADRVPPVAAASCTTPFEGHLRRDAREVGKCARKGCDAPRLLGRVYCGDHGVTMTDTLDNIRVIPPAPPTVPTHTWAGPLVRKAGGGGSMDALRRFLALETDRVS